MFESHRSLRDDFEVSSARAGRAGRHRARARRRGRRARRAHDRRRLRRLHGHAGPAATASTTSRTTLDREYRRRTGPGPQLVRVAPGARRAHGRSGDGDITSSVVSDDAQRPHRRFNPLTGDWVLVSPHRTQRPWQGGTEAPAAEQRPGLRSRLLPLPRQRARRRRRQPALREDVRVRQRLPGVFVAAVRRRRPPGRRDRSAAARRADAAARAASSASARATI